ncbi:hypothetical protein BJ875DRAFT_485424 [Amylocarpus encephaloides]|uniref:Uncharacterized protein n=1 Tax=Amylocarpus encephaloides TaxID=45428 RepID=A0A9P8C4G5_9HELO|nr:hypothetical protein BJ875DRAFT_485424 [Amylocarpus encephaloides]
MTAPTPNIIGSAGVFEQLENYHWDNDKEFQGGLSAILGPNPSPSQIQDLTLRAQCFYLSRKHSINIDFNAYKSYLLNKDPEGFPATSPSQPQPLANMPHAVETNGASHEAEVHLPTPTPMAAPSSTSQGPSLAVQAPDSTQTSSNLDGPSIYPTARPSSYPTHENDLPPASVTNLDDHTVPEQAPYPSTFAEIVALITSGAEIPGIMEIPNIVLPHLASKPTIPRRRKPWETDIPEDVILNGPGEGTFGDRRDNHIVQEFPEDDFVPVSEEAVSQSTV